MTVIEVLEQTRSRLAMIQVRVGDMETVGAPIYAAVANLTAVIDTLKKQEDEHEDDHDTGEAVSG